MIVHIVNVDSVAIVPAKREAPVTRYGNGIFAAAIAREGMKTEPRQVEIAWVHRRVQSIKHERELAGELGGKATSVVPFPEALQSPAFE